MHNIFDVEFQTESVKTVMDPQNICMYEYFNRSIN